MPCDCAHGPVIRALGPVLGEGPDGGMEGDWDA